MLSPNELDVMDLLWSENRALTRGEIIDMSPNKSWKPSTIHLLLNSLLKKEIIHVEGFKQSVTNYGRTFIASITREEYTAQELSQRFPTFPSSRQANLVGVFAAMVENAQVNEATLEELQRILDEKKGMLPK